ncbi:unnamed protein product [Symbiodinium sp. CCMP2592]|nr:unnamed protein product [Symbiodinium sp. CCMP2592]
MWCRGCAASSEDAQACGRCRGGWSLDDTGHCTACMDLPGFLDAQGRNCYDITQGKSCSGERFHGMSSAVACCGCMGGLRAATAFGYYTEPMLLGQRTAKGYPLPRTASRYSVDSSCKLLDFNLTINGTTGELQLAPGCDAVGCGSATENFEVSCVITAHEGDLNASTPLHISVFKFMAYQSSLLVIGDEKTRTFTPSFAPQVSPADLHLNCLPAVPSNNWLQLRKQGELLVNASDAREVPGLSDLKLPGLEDASGSLCYIGQGGNFTPVAVLVPNSWSSITYAEAFVIVAPGAALGPSLQPIPTGSISLASADGYSIFQLDIETGALQVSPEANVSMLFARTALEIFRRSYAARPAARILAAEFTRPPVYDSPIEKIANCSMEHTCLNLTGTEPVWLYSGIYCPVAFGLEPVTSQLTSVYRKREPVASPRFDIFYLQASQTDPDANCSFGSLLLTRSNVTWDFQNTTSKYIELFGSHVACLQSHSGAPVVPTAFETGMEDLLVQNEADYVGRGLQLTLGSQFCSPSGITTNTGSEEGEKDAGMVDEVFLVDDPTTTTPNDYSLHPCDCFPMSWGTNPPVSTESFMSVPPEGSNDFLPEAIPIVQGSFRCDQEALLPPSVAQPPSVPDELDCRKACQVNPPCAFFWFGEAANLRQCLLYSKCETIFKEKGASGTLSAVVRRNVCRRADPKKCWSVSKRRAFLQTGREDSEKAQSPCIYSRLVEQCDLQLLLGGMGVEECFGCTHAFVNEGDVWPEKRRMPALLLPGSQLRYSCWAERYQAVTPRSPGTSGSNYTISCVGGSWWGDDGEPGLSGFACGSCVQVVPPGYVLFEAQKVQELFFLPNLELNVLIDQLHPLYLNMDGTLRELHELPRPDFANVHFMLGGAALPVSHGESCLDWRGDALIHSECQPSWCPLPAAADCRAPLGELYLCRADNKALCLYASKRLLLDVALQPHCPTSFARPSSHGLPVTVQLRDELPADTSLLQLRSMQTSACASEWPGGATSPLDGGDWAIKHAGPSIPGSFQLRSDQDTKQCLTGTEPALTDAEVVLVMSACDNISLAQRFDLDSLNEWLLAQVAASAMNASRTAGAKEEERSASPLFRLGFTRDCGEYCLGNLSFDSKAPMFEGCKLASAIEAPKEAQVTFVLPTVRFMVGMACAVPYAPDAKSLLLESPCPISKSFFYQNGSYLESMEYPGRCIFFRTVHDKKHLFDYEVKACGTSEEGFLFGSKWNPGKQALSDGDGQACLVFVNNDWGTGAVLPCNSIDGETGMRIVEDRNVLECPSGFLLSYVFKKPFSAKLAYKCSRMALIGFFGCPGLLKNRKNMRWPLLLAVSASLTPGFADSRDSLSLYFNASTGEWCLSIPRMCVRSYVVQPLDDGALKGPEWAVVAVTDFDGNFNPAGAMTSPAAKIPRSKPALVTLTASKPEYAKECKSLVPDWELIGQDLPKENPCKYVVGTDPAKGQDVDPDETGFASWREETLAAGGGKPDSGFSYEKILGCFSRQSKRNKDFAILEKSFGMAGFVARTTGQWLKVKCSWLGAINQAPFGFGFTWPTGDVCKETLDAIGRTVQNSFSVAPLIAKVVLDEKAKDDCSGQKAAFSRVWCDLHCVKDAVVKGNAAVLNSLEGAVQVLNHNVDALTAYHASITGEKLDRLSKRIDEITTTSKSTFDIQQMRGMLNLRLARVRDLVVGADMDSIGHAASRRALEGFIADLRSEMRTPLANSTASDKAEYLLSRTEALHRALELSGKQRVKKTEAISAVTAKAAIHMQDLARSRNHLLGIYHHRSSQWKQGQKQLLQTARKKSATEVFAFLETSQTSQNDVWQVLLALDSTWWEFRAALDKYLNQAKHYASAYLRAATTLEEYVSCSARFGEMQKYYEEFLQGEIGYSKALKEAWSTAVPLAGLLVSKLVDSNALLKLTAADAKTAEEKWLQADHCTGNVTHGPASLALLDTLATEVLDQTLDEGLSGQTANQLLTVLQELRMLHMSFLDEGAYPEDVDVVTQTIERAAEAMQDSTALRPALAQHLLKLCQRKRLERPSKEQAQV